MTRSHNTVVPQKYLDLREFISSSVYRAEIPHNHYDLDRLNFCYSVASTMNDTSSEQFLDRCHIWRDSRGRILSAVVHEGENRGEAFFICTEQELDILLAHEMLAFTEEYCSNRPMAIPELPDGFTLHEGHSCTAEQKGECHSMAFGYAGNSIYETRIIEGFRAMQEMPDYLPFLDLMLSDSKGQAAAIMSFWHDPLNRRGNLEPAATHPEHQGKGLGRFLIQEGARRLQRLGVQQLLVGTDLDFYLHSGFDLLKKTPVLEKHFR